MISGIFVLCSLALQVLCYGAPLENLNKNSHASSRSAIFHPRPELLTPNKQLGRIFSQFDIPYSVSLSKHTFTAQADIEGRKDIKRLKRANKHQSHVVIIASLQQNLDKLDELLMDVSDPRSSKYGQHYSKSQIKELTINHEAVTQITNYLHANGLKILNQTDGGEFITVEGSVEQLEAMLDTEFHEFEQQPIVVKGIEVKHLPAPRRYLRAFKYSLPTTLIPHVRAIFNTVQFPPRLRSKSLFVTPLNITKTEYLRRHSNTKTHYDSNVRDKRLLRGGVDSQRNHDSNSSVADSSSSVSRKNIGTANAEVLGYVYPALLNDVYDIRSNAASAAATQGVYEAIGQMMSPPDLKAFQERFNLPVEALAHIIGGHVSPNACSSQGGQNCVEANLDVSTTSIFITFFS